MTRDVLDPAALIASLPTLLPEDSKKLQSPQDGLAALLHTAMSALAFRLVAVDERPSQSLVGNKLPSEWNRGGPESYSFKYRHEQSSLEFVLKVIRLGNRTLVNAIASETDKVLSLDMPTNDFVSPSFFPHEIGAGDTPLIHGFISSNRVADLMSQFKLMVVQKLVPGLRKEGYQEEAAPASGQPGTSQSGPARPEPSRPVPQPFEPPILPYMPPRNPLEIGRRDLDPIPMNPFNPPSLFPHGGDGMFVGPDHPIFGPRGGPVGGRGPWGGDGFLPPMGAPPGARFDPVGPGPISPGRGGLRGGRPGRGGVPPHGGDPDNDEFMPPGAGDMYM
ncbi:hypothetical protein AX16_000122 [Volvariella volvacea WC 439]|nr:hypothetical protein AX16_000122 [Volvariella volvacea WC 439]